MPVRLLCLAVLFSGFASAQTVYRCDTDDGVEFSAQPCADDAAEIQLKSSAPRAERAAPRRGSLSSEAVDEAMGETEETVLEILGAPAARFHDDGTAHWLYPNACEGDPPVCPMLLLEHGRNFQISWIPQDVMVQSVEVARGFAGFEPPATIRMKSFYATGQDLRGASRTVVQTRLGSPDVKKVFMGAEWWEYHQVRISRQNADLVVLYLEFDEGRVVGTAAN